MTQARGSGRPRLRTAVVLAITLTAGASRDVFAQSVMQHEAVDLGPGARVRVTAPETGQFVGTLLQATNDSLRIELARGSSIVMPTSRVTRLELSAGVQRHGWKGAGIGLVSGAIVGGAIGLATYRRPSCIPDPLAQLFCDLIERTSREVTVAGDAALAGTAGAVIGALIGHAARETWVRVPTIGVRARVGLVGGPGLGVRITT